LKTGFIFLLILSFSTAGRNLFLNPKANKRNTSKKIPSGRLERRQF
jgi:hypothetical protein